MRKYEQFRRMHDERVERMQTSDKYARECIVVENGTAQADASEAPTGPHPETPLSMTQSVDALADVSGFGLKARLMQMREMELRKGGTPDEDEEELPTPPESPKEAQSDTLSKKTVHELKIRRLQDLDIIWSTLKVRLWAVPGGGGRLRGRLSATPILYEMSARNLFGGCQDLHGYPVGRTFAHSCATPEGLVPPT